MNPTRIDTTYYVLVEPVKSCKICKGKGMNKSLISCACCWEEVTTTIEVLHGGRIVLTRTIDHKP